MSEYTPNTERVRSDYGENSEGTSEKRLAAFDRWLAAHDRQVAQEALKKASLYFFEKGDWEFDGFGVSHALDMDAAAIVPEPSTPEVTGAFRKMDALAARGEDTPEYRTAFAEFERAARDTSTSAPEQEGQNR